MKSVIASAAVLALLTGAAGSQSKGGKLPWAKGTPQKALAQAMKDGQNSFLYFTSEG